MNRIAQWTIIGLIGAVLAPVARAQEADAAEMERQLTLAEEPARLAEKVSCDSNNTCVGLVPDLFARYLIYGPEIAGVWFVAKPVLRNAMLAAGCTSNYWLFAYGENRYRWANQVSIAQALGTNIIVVFEPRVSKPEECEIRWMYREMS